MSNPVISEKLITDLSNGKLAEIKAFATKNGLTGIQNKTFTRPECISQYGS